MISDQKEGILDHSESTPLVRYVRKVHKALHDLWIYVTRRTVMLFSLISAKKKNCEIGVPEDKVCIFLCSFLLCCYIIELLCLTVIDFKYVCMQEIREVTVNSNFPSAVVLLVIKYCALIRSDFVFILTINIFMKYNTFILYYLKVYIFFVTTWNLQLYHFVRI
jgi:hypothetical protein